MATHSSIHACKIPWMEKPGKLHTAHGVAKSGIRLHFHFLIVISASHSIGLRDEHVTCQSQWRVLAKESFNSDPV